MNISELERSLRQLRLGGMAAVLENRLRQAQSEPMAPIDLISCLVSDELSRRSDRLLERRRKQARLRDPNKTLDNFDFTFNPKMNRSLIFDLATGAFIGKHENALFLGPGGAGKSHLVQAIGQAAIQQGYRVLYRETHVLLDELAHAVAEGTRKQFMETLTTVPLLIIDDFGMRKLPLTAAEDLLEIVMRRYERASTLLTSNRPVEDWGKLLGDVWHLSVPCSIACSTTDTCSSVVRAAGAPKPSPPRQKRNSNFQPAAARSLISPFSVSPSGGKPGPVPPTPRHAARQPKPLSRFVRGAPPTRGLRPLVHPRCRATSSHTRLFMTGGSSKITLAKIPTVRLKMILFWVHPVGRFSPDPHWPLFT
jgi:DNA replication protein DnaC